MSGNPDFSLSRRIGRKAIRVLSTLRGPTANKIVFVHVPKCGGNSIMISLINSVPYTRRFTWVAGPETRKAASVLATGAVDEAAFHDDTKNGAAVYALRRGMSLVSLELGHQVVGGHFLFDAAAFDIASAEYRWVTVLRDPVQRMISHYREERRSGFLDMPFEAYLDTDMAQRHATMITRYMTGVVEPDDLRTDAVVSAAKRNLEKFSAIGFIDDMTTFDAALSSITQRKISTGHSRRSAVSAPDIDAAAMRRVQEMTRQDQIVFDHARAASPRV